MVPSAWARPGGDSRIKCFCGTTIPDASGHPARISVPATLRIGSWEVPDGSARRRTWPTSDPGESTSRRWMSSRRHEWRLTRS